MISRSTSVTGASVILKAPCLSVVRPVGHARPTSTWQRCPRRGNMTLTRSTHRCPMSRYRARHAVCPAAVPARSTRRPERRLKRHRTGWWQHRLPRRRRQRRRDGLRRHDRRGRRRRRAAAPGRGGGALGRGGGDHARHVLPGPRRTPARWPPRWWTRAPVRSRCSSTGCRLRCGRRGRWSSPPPTPGPRCCTSPVTSRAWRTCRPPGCRWTRSVG